ncbi:hypothetical protein DV738_g2020, partial [Chaetothyriales sp. CBS 135597]
MLIFVAGVVAQAVTAPSTHSSQPNIIFILTDDQDVHMDSLLYMPFLKKHLIDEGLVFERHYCTVALCCPSRVSLWTGKAAHNTNVTDVNPPYGGYPKFISQGFNDAYLPVWLQEAGYETYYVGKLFNAHTVDNYASPYPAGFTGSDFLLDPFTYEYLNATMQRNRDPPVSYEGQYSTDVMAEKTFGFLDEALQNEKPFFLTFAPTAPHSNVNIKSNIIDGNFSEHSVAQSPPIPAERHRDLFADVVVPRRPDFNPDTPHGVSWISRLPKQNQTNIDFNDHFYRSRLRALQAVDETIDGLFARLSAAGALGNTYIFFSTDNGYHIGSHRLQPGKQCAFEDDINIPLIVRGPDVPKRQTTQLVTTHTDLAPTFLSLTGASARTDLDGSVIPLSADQIKQASLDIARTEHVNVESWGIIMSEGKYGSVLYPNHTYKALRVIGEGYNLLYTVWCSGEHELYNVKEDPFEMHNLYDDQHTLTFSFSRSGSVHTIPIARLLTRLDALLLVLKTCKGSVCVHPWSLLHRDGKVTSLHDALDSKYDGFYSQQQSVGFTKCEKGYIIESERPDRVAKSWIGLEEIEDVGVMVDEVYVPKATDSSLWREKTEL